MIKTVSIITIIAVVVVSLAIVAIARYQRTVYPTVARGLSVATDNSLSNLAADTLIAADKATAAPEFAKGVWINSDPLTMEKLRGQVVLVEFWAFNCDNCRNTLPSVTGWDAEEFVKAKVRMRTSLRLWSTLLVVQLLALAYMFRSDF